MVDEVGAGTAMETEAAVTTEMDPLDLSHWRKEL